MSATEECVLLVDPSGKTVDAVSFTNQVADVSFGRFANGTGSFRSMIPTYNAVNIGSVSTQDQEENQVTLKAYPNPTNGTFTLEIKNNSKSNNLVSVYNINGMLIYQTMMDSDLLIDASPWNSGMYIIRVASSFIKIVKN